MFLPLPGVAVSIKLWISKAVKCFFHNTLEKNWNFSQIQFGIVSTSHNLCFLENERILPHQENALQGTFWQKYAIFWQYSDLAIELQIEYRKTGIRSRP